MAAIGALLFCAQCGNLLDSTTGNPSNIVTCDVCGAGNKDVSSNSVVTRSKPSAFPSALRNKHSDVQQVDDNLKRSAKIKQPCEKCGRDDQVSYYTLQLRSADEGTTVFYDCECGHKWNTNN